MIAIIRALVVLVLASASVIPTYLGGELLEAWGPTSLNLSYGHVFGVTKLGTAIGYLAGSIVLAVVFFVIVFRPAAVTLWADSVAAWRGCLAWLRRCGDQFHASSDPLLRFVYGMWIARASTASVLAAALLFYGVQPAQDLFLQVSDKVHPTIVHWLLFYLVVTVAWLFPIYLSARWVLTRWNRLAAATQARHTPVAPWVSRMVPPVLATACLLIILAAQIFAGNRAPSPINDSDSFRIANDFGRDFHDACPNVAPGFFNPLDYINLFHELPTSGEYSDSLSKCSKLKLSGLLLESVAGVDPSLFFLYAVCIGFLVWLSLRRYSRAPQHAYARVAATCLWWICALLLGLAALLSLLLMLVIAINEGTIAINQGTKEFALARLVVLPGLSAYLALLVYRWLRPVKPGEPSRLARELLRVRHSSRVDDTAAFELLVQPAFTAVALVSVVLLFCVAILVHPIDVIQSVLFLRRTHLLPLFLGTLVPPLTFLAAATTMKIAVIRALVVLVLASASMTLTYFGGVLGVIKFGSAIGYLAGSIVLPVVLFVIVFRRAAVPLWVFRRAAVRLWGNFVAAWRGCFAWLRCRGDASWDTVLRLAYGLWIARASTASVLAGALLFCGVQQAQDLFLEVRDSVHLTIVHWLLFYLVVVVAWVFPVYLSARWVLTRWNRLAAIQARRTPVDPWVRRMVPPLLATACLLTIFAGPIQAVNSAPSLINDLPDRIKVERESKAQFRDACPDVDEYAPSLSKCNTLKLLVLALERVADADSILFYPYAVCEDVPLFVEHCEAAVAEVDVTRR
jgi:hypothetical protein